MQSIRVRMVWLACLFSSASSISFAADDVNYSGKWRLPTPAINLNIGAESAQIEIDGNTYTDNSLQFIPNPLSSTPFLYLDTQAAQTEHHFYLMLSSDAQNRPQLNGYHDRITLSNNGQKTIESTPVTLQYQQKLSIVQ